MFCESTVLKRLKNFFSFSTMATSFETCDTILTQGQADHINERHVSITEHPRTSKFWLTFNLSSTLADLSARTWEEDEDVILLESGFKKGHGFITYSYSPSMKRLVGNPEGFPAKYIAIYYSEKRKGNKWEIISAYPFTHTYRRYFLSKRKPWLCYFFIVRTSDQTTNGSFRSHHLNKSYDHYSEKSQ